MTQEEKVKRYDEALKAAVFAHKDEDKHLKATLERIFPELKQSKDERIKNDLKRAVSVALDYSYLDEKTANNCLAWLEKQGEQKIAEWSEEDDQYLLVCKNALRKYQVTDKWDFNIIS